MHHLPEPRRKPRRDVHSRTTTSNHGYDATSGFLELIRVWYTTPHNFDWIFVHKSTRPMHNLLRVVFAGAVALYACSLVLMMASPNGPSSTGPRVYAYCVLVVQAAVIMWILFAPLPDRKWQFVAFLMFGDVGLMSVLLTYTPTSALFGTILFAFTGAMCTFFLGPKWLLTHLAFSNLVVLYFGIQSYVQGWGAYDAVAAVLVASGAISGVPVFAQIAWSLVSEDARGSEIDSLTGTSNRRGLQNSLDDLWARAHRDRAAIVVVMVDIDRFKSVNDRFGHDQGDAVIILVADRLSDLFGKLGVLARTGGEEFVAVLVGELDDLVGVVDGVSGRLHNRADPVPVTVSTGAAVLVPDSTPWLTGPSALTHATRTADSLMYAAKASGGNKVMAQEV